MSNEAPANTPGYLIRSFIIVVTCYLLFLMGLAIVCGSFFPDAFQAMGLEEEKFKELLENNAANLFPRGRFLPIVIVMLVVSAAVGWLSIKLSNFAKMSHAIFLVLVVGVTLFQMVFKTIPELQWLFIVLVGACPIGILIGAKRAMPPRDMDSHNEIDPALEDSALEDSSSDARE